MAITVNVQNNPNRNKVTKADADATIINSGISTGIVHYNIMRYDEQESIMIASDEDITSTTYAQITFLSNAHLHIILTPRTKYKVRVRQEGGNWLGWVTFKTRDKRYQSPDAITQLSDNAGTTATTKTNRTIIVTNSAKASVEIVPTGATVRNTDKMYNSVTSMYDTPTGATVYNSD